jgi:hypothetical protein
LYERVLQYCCCCEGGDCCCMNECYNIVVVVKVGVSKNQIAISIATRPFKFREMSVSISTRSFVFSIHSFVHSTQPMRARTPPAFCLIFRSTTRALLASPKTTYLCYSTAYDRLIRFCADCFRDWA